MHGQWVNFLYHYGVGGSFYVFSMVMLYKGGALRWERSSDRLVAVGLTGGLLAFATIHAIWIGSVI
jgi:hypothetical protein